MVIYLLFFFYFCKLLLLFFTFFVLYHILIELSSEIVILKLYSTTKLLISSAIKPMKVFLQERATPTLEMEIILLLIQPKISLMILRHGL